MIQKGATMGTNNKKEIDLIHIKNDINRINTQELNEIDLNVFFTICASFKESGENKRTIEIPFDEFLDLTKVKKSTLNTRKKFIDFADKKTERLGNLQVKYKTEEQLKIVKFVETITIPPNKDVVAIEITTKFAQLLHDYSGDYTEFFLTNFVSIQGKYAKNLYRLLMKFDDTGTATFRIDDFKLFMGIPSGYRPKDIKQKVIDPAIEMILERKLFMELTYEPDTAHKRGNKITGYTFNFRIAANDDMSGQTKLKQYANNELGYSGMKTKKSKNSFNNFQQNTYDYDKLEEQLLDN